MPSKSEAMARLMAAAAHNPEFAKKMGIKVSVAKEFNEADKGTALLHDAMKHAAKERAEKKAEDEEASEAASTESGPRIYTW
jgi:hypothetical protein